MRENPVQERVKPTMPDGSVAGRLGANVSGAAEPERRSVMSSQLAGPGDSPIEIVSRGPVGERSRRRLRKELARLAEESPRRAIFVRGALTFEQNPSVARPALASATIDLGRRVVRARVAATGAATAIDLLVARLRRSMRDLRGRDEAARHRLRGDRLRAV